MRRSWLHPVVCAWTAAAITAGGCRTGPRTVAKPAPQATRSAPAAAVPATSRQSVTIDTAAEEGKLTTRLGEAPAVHTGVVVETLPAAATQALLARLEPLPELDHRSAPVVRPPSAPPPRAGAVQPIAFIAPTGKVIADRPVSDAPPGVVPPLAPPQVLPIGEVRTEREIRVRFPEPMIAIAAVGTASSAPARISPEIAGTWRWVDTRVAMFDAADARLPHATQFTVTVPAGTRAISGAALPADHVATFSTPPVTIIGTYPRVKLRPDSPVVVELDQDVDPKALAAYLRVEDAKNRKRLAFEIISLDEARLRWAKNPAIARARGSSPTDAIATHHVVLAPKTAWPAGIAARVVLARKAPSREGPRVTERETAGSFEVAPAFVARGLECHPRWTPRLANVTCPAWSSVTVRFSNSIDATTYRSNKVQIAGLELDDHKPSHDSVSLDVPGKAARSYTVALADDITDIYGQTLGGTRRLPFTTTREVHEPLLLAHAGLQILDPRFEIPQWIVNAQAVASFSVELYQVTPADYFAYQDFERGTRRTPPGKRVYAKQHAIGARHGGTARVDLRPALSASGTGHVIAIARAVPAPGAKLQERQVLAWIQVSRLGITARFDGERAHAWVLDVTPSTFLRPLPNVATSLLVENRRDAPPPVTTDANGHATYELLPHVERDPQQEPPTALLLAASGDDSTFAELGYRYEKAVRARQARWYVTDDRFTYKPGETVYVKGWVRWVDDGVNPDLALPAAGDAVTYSLTDSRGNRVARGTATFTKHGGFDMEVALPSNINLGLARFSLSTNHGTYSHAIAVEEFRTPAYAVSLTDDVMFGGTQPLVLGESIEMSTEAKYYAGGGLAGAGVRWDVTLSPASYQPPGWDRFTFSHVRPRSQRGRHAREFDPVKATETGSLSGASTSALSIGIAALPGAAPSVLTVDAAVTDIDRQTIRASSRAIVVHPAALYVGLRLEPSVRDSLQLVVTDLDGNAVAGVPIEVEIEGVLGSERDRDGAAVTDTQRCSVSSAAVPVSCKFVRKDVDTAYTAIARIADARGRANAAQLMIPWWARPDRDFAVHPDKPSYKPGDVARLDVRSKRVPATAIVSYARQGVIAQKRVELVDESTIVELPIEPAFVPNVHVVVDRVGKRRHNYAKSPLPLPSIESTQLELPVDLESARLVMRTRPLQPLVEPGGEASFEVHVAHDDKPVAGAEVALLVIDEAVLAVSGKSHADPLAPFYRAVRAGTWQTATFDMVVDAGHDLLGDPGFERWSIDELGRGIGTGSGYGYGAGYGSMGGRSSAHMRTGDAFIKARKDFRPTAVFSPRLTTDERGRVRVTVTMPDSLTRYRVVALATANTRNFGKAESTLVVQRKVNARTVAPRFLTQGDTFALPVVVQNLDTRPRTIDVAVRAANLASAGPAGKRVTVAAGQRAEVRFDLATEARGKAVIQTIAMTDGFADASTIELPVYVPATTESFATYGAVEDKPHYEQLAVPANIFPEVGGVEAEVSSTQLQSVTDAYWYLYAYPFECAEQRSARMLATSALLDILDAFAVPGRPTRQQVEERRATDVKRLARDQGPDGGWGFFGDMASDPFVTMQVLHALAAQGERGDTATRAAAYVTKRADGVLAQLAKQARGRDVVEVRRPDDAANVSLAATALSVLAATGTDVTPRALRLHALAVQLASYPVDAKARVLAIVAGQPRHRELRDRLVAELLSVVHETAAAASVAATYTDAERMLLVSNTKTTALVLDALLRETPQHALISKLARGVLDARRGGRWRSTQENLVALQAIRRYFDIYEKDTPSYTGKLWLGTAAYTEHAVAGRSSERATAHATWSMLEPGSTHDIALSRAGTGRMYFRLGITYAPKDIRLPPLDAGFVVRRSYRAVDDPADVVQDPDGRIRVKLGARVLVQLEAINTAQRHGVALVDPLPAGFEAVNTRLATAERAVVDPGASRWDHTNMRDNRSEAFAMELAAGVHRFSYTARATTPGTFMAAPAKAEEMYSPETFGRSAGSVVIVE